MYPFENNLLAVHLRRMPSFTSMLWQQKKVREPRAKDFANMTPKANPNNLVNPRTSAAPDLCSHSQMKVTPGSFVCWAVCYITHYTDLLPRLWIDSERLQLADTSVC